MHYSSSFDVYFLIGFIRFVGYFISHKSLFHSFHSMILTIYMLMSLPSLFHSSFTVI